MPRTTLFAQVACPDSLTTAWEDIAQRGDEGERLAESISRFRRAAGEKLAALHDELLDGTYRPAHLHQILIPKSEGDFRALAVPPVRDRVVERAILMAITPHVDPWLGPASYAYRPGLGVADAVQEVARLRDEGLRWVLRADIENCFGTIPRERATRLLAAALPDDTLDRLLALLTARRVVTSRGLREVSGIPQGTALSPIMANLVLVHLDDALLDRGFGLVRYADDFTAVCDSAREAWEAARTASAALREIGMGLSADKTEVMCFDDGFCFLGEDFGPRYPPVIERHRVAEPLRRVLYAARQGSRLFTAKGRLVVESADDEAILDVALSHVSRIVCFGSIGISAGVRSWAFANDTDVVFLSRRGTYLGQMLAGSSSTRPARVRSQCRLEDDPTRRQAFARAVVEAKIRHQLTLVRRLARRQHADDIAGDLGQMKGMCSMLPMAESAADLMGIEGAAARSYFRILTHVLPSQLGFTGRTRKPPMDVANAALSYGYAVLLAECVSAIAAAGLDPAFGMLHADDAKRPSLALDLMEEFRPMIVDQVVVTLARRGILTADHGTRREGEPGVWLTKAARTVLTDRYEQRMLQITSGALPGFTGSLRRHLYRQAERLAAFIADDDTGWTGLSWR